MNWKEISLWAKKSGYDIERIPKGNKKYTYNWKKGDSNDSCESSFEFVTSIYNHMTSYVHLEHQKTYKPLDNDV